MRRILNTAIPFILVGVAVFLALSYWKPNNNTDLMIADKSYVSRDYKKAIHIYEENRSKLSKNQLLNLANSYLKVGIPDKAVTIYETMEDNEEITKEYLGSFYLKMANLNYQRLNIEEAREYFEKAILNSQSPTLKLKVKREYGLFISDNPTDDTINKGIDYLLEVTKLPSNQQDYRLIFQLGNLYYFSGELEQAIKSWKKSLSINHQFVPAYEMLGILMLDIEQYEEAKEIFKEGINHKNRTWRLHFGLGEAYYNLKDNKKALHHYKEVLSSNPKHYPTHYQMAIIYMDMGNNKAASEHLYTIVKNVPDSELGKQAMEDLDGKLSNFLIR